MPAAVAAALVGDASKAGWSVQDGGGRGIWGGALALASSSAAASSAVGLAAAARAYCLRTFGLPSLADRYLVDLCFNARNLQKFLPRCLQEHTTTRILASFFFLPNTLLFNRTL